MAHYTVLTDAEEEEKQPNLSGSSYVSRVRRVCRSASTKIVLLATTCTFVGVIVGVIFSHVMLNPSHQHPLPDHDDNLGQSHIPVHFVYSDAYKDLSSAGDELWHALLPKNDVVRWKDGKDVEHTQGFTMFHELHCLVHLRMTIQSLTKSDDTASMPMSMPVDDHVLHCLDYLRQTTLCHADSYVEETISGNNGDMFVNGVLEERQCRNSQILWKLLDSVH